MSRTALVDVYELTPMQHGMLFHQLYAPNEGFYVEQSVLTLTGRPDREAFWRAWQLIVDRHDALRTAFRWEGIAKPVQAVRARVALPREEHDWRGYPPAEQQRLLDDLLRDERHRGFDLEVPPLMRVALCLVADDRFYLALRLSHLVVDGWSIGLIFSDFTAAYRAYARGAEPVLAPASRFREYVAWWKDREPAAVEPFWRRYLADFHPPAPLCLGGEGGGHDPRRSFDWVDLPLHTLAEELQDWSRQHRLTLNTLVQAAWTLALGRVTGATDVMVGMSFAHRPPEVPGVESIVGCMVGTVPVRSSIEPGRPVLEWLRALQDDIMATRDHATAGLNEIQRWSSAPAGTQLFESIVSFQNMPLPSFTLGDEGLGLDGYDMFTRPHTPLILLALPGDDLPLRLVFDRRRVSPARARALLNGVGTALASIVHTEPTRVGCVDSGVVTARDESDPAPESAGGQAPAAQTVGGEPATETEAALCAIFADLLSLGRVGPHDNLVEFGLHSLLGTQAINRIRDEWRTAVPLQALFDRPTVAALAAIIEAGGVADDPRHGTRPPIDLVREALLDPAIAPQGDAAWLPVPERVLLTGATGYLGSALLERLLRTTPARVVCLARSLDPDEGRRRIHEVLAAAGQWDEGFDERIEVLPGNLAQPRLGLDPATFTALAEGVDEVFHLAAVANTMPPYRRVKPTNVNGTREVLRLATTARALPVFHISPAEVTDVDDPERRGRELPLDEPPRYLPNGYIQSKWVADRLVGEAARRPGHGGTYRDLHRAGR